MSKKSNDSLKIFVIVFLFVSMVVSCAQVRTQSAGKDKTDIIVEIDYGFSRPVRTIRVTSMEGKNALEVLQRVARVETQPVGQYVFVTSIDGIEGKRGEMAWYYTVNSKPAGKLAFSNLLRDGDCMKWTYKKDVCSAKVDKDGT